VFTNDDRLAEDLRAIVNHGMKIRYYHDMIGVNSRLDSIQAAILKVKLRYLDDYAKERNRAAAYYDSAFNGHPKLKIPHRSTNSTHVFHQYTLMTSDLDRDGLLEYLKSKDIPAAIYYPVPLHLQKAYLSPRYREGDLPVTEEASKRVISLPMSTELDEEQLEYITSAVLEYANRV
jgi:dTDP-4-amino-4,6-dideoxygalactose transaminase